MFQILKKLERKHVTNTREMTIVLAKCCHCGVEQELLEQNVQKSNRQGRLHCKHCIEETFHRLTGTRPYQSWRSMVSRCTKPKDADYPNYGGRGITCDPAWMDFNGFWHDMADGYSDNLTLERKDVNGPYSKANCCWLSSFEQQGNKRTSRLILFQGRTMHLAQYCREIKASRGAMTPYLQRYEYWDGDAALATYLAATYPKGRKSRSTTS